MISEEEGLENEYNEEAALRFLQERNFDPQKSFSLIKNDSVKFFNFFLINFFFKIYYLS